MRKEDNLAGHLKKLWFVYVIFLGAASANIYFERSAVVSMTTMGIQVETNAIDISTVVVALDDFMDLANTNFRYNDLNSQIRQQETTKFIIQGQLDTVKRVLESRPGEGLEAYRINRDTYEGQIQTIDYQISNLKEAMKR